MCKLLGSLVEIGNGDASFPLFLGALESVEWHLWKDKYRF